MNVLKYIIGDCNQKLKVLKGLKVVAQKSFICIIDTVYALCSFTELILFYNLQVDFRSIVVTEL